MDLLGIDNPASFWGKRISAHFQGLRSVSSREGIPYMDSLRIQGFTSHHLWCCEESYHLPIGLPMSHIDRCSWIAVVKLVQRTEKLELMGLLSVEFS